MIKSIFRNTPVFSIASNNDCLITYNGFKGKVISPSHKSSTMPPNMETIQEQLWRLVKPASRRPSIFRDRPSTPDEASHPQDDLALDYISRMLMEDDIDDKFFFEFPDHPALLQAQQSFAEILSEPGTSASDAQESLTPRMLAPAVLLHAVEEPNISSSPEEVSSRMHMVPNMAFLEEAPTNNLRNCGVVDGRGRKNRFDRSGDLEAEVGRSSKQIMLPVQPDAEEFTAMFENLTLSFDMCPNQAHKPHAAVEGEKKKKVDQQRKTPRGGRGGKQAPVADLETLLIRCAEAVAANDQHNAVEQLERIKRLSSPAGNATQRLAHYFVTGLEARMAGPGSQLYHSLLANQTSAADVLKAYQLLLSPCCFLKLSHIFSNKTIHNAIAGKKKLHIVHYGMDDGFQWPELLQCLAGREGGPPEVRITGINRPQPGFRPAQRLEEAGRRLSRLASNLGVQFKFHAIAANLESVKAEDLSIDPDEVLVVNSLFHFESLMDESLSVDRINPRNLVLNTIRKMKPSVFIHAVVNGSYSAAIFMTRFREAIYYFGAHFDALEATVPRDSDKRLLVEREIFARSAMNIIACEGADRVQRPHNFREWQTRNQRAGLRQLPLDPEIVRMLKDKLKQQYHKDYMINEDKGWLLQGWKGRVLYALSTWSADGREPLRISK